MLGQKTWEHGMCIPPFAEFLHNIPNMIVFIPPAVRKGPRECLQIFMYTEAFELDLWLDDT